jgi:uncharacterized membrane protein
VASENARDTTSPSDPAGHRARAVEDRAVQAATRNVGRIAQLVREQHYNATTSERLGGGISRIAGSLTFVAGNLAAIVVWMAWNTWAPAPWRFDPFPFGVLTMVVSLEGVLLACFVLVAQNRMTQQAERRNHLQLQINILAEQEVTVIMRMLQHLTANLHVPPFQEEMADLAGDTDLGVIVREIDRQVPLES